MTMPQGLVRLWHSSKVWTAIAGFTLAVAPQTLALLPVWIHATTMDPATYTAAMAALFSAYKLAGTALAAALIAATGLEDSLRKVGITLPLPNEFPIGDPRRPQPPAGGTR